jgi:hypothetical protein
MKRDRSRHPQWVLKHKKTGTEIRVINGHYYLYAISSKWDSTKKTSSEKDNWYSGKDY